MKIVWTPRAQRNLRDAARYLTQFNPFAALSMIRTIRVAPTLAGAATGLAALAIVGVYGAACLAILRGRAPFHDWWAGTRVIATP